MTAEESLFRKFLDHSYIHSYTGHDDKLGTYPPFDITDEEREVFRMYRESGVLFGEQIGYRQWNRNK